MCHFVGEAPSKDAGASNPNTSHSKGSAEEIAEAGQGTKALDINADTSHSKGSAEEIAEAGKDTKALDILGYAVLKKIRPRCFNRTVL